MKNESTRARCAKTSIAFPVLTKEIEIPQNGSPCAEGTICGRTHELTLIRDLIISNTE